MPIQNQLYVPTLPIYMQTALLMPMVFLCYIIQPQGWVNRKFNFRPTIGVVLSPHTTFCVNPNIFRSVGKFNYTFRSGYYLQQSKGNKYAAPPAIYDIESANQIATVMVIKTIAV